jgi:maltose alpha-D-glucosyltransferase/alpha-amylase
MHAYLAEMKGTALIPHEPAEIRIMLENYTFEKLLYSLNYELNYRPEWSIVPIRAISMMMKG